MSCFFVRFLGQSPSNYIVVFDVHTLECLPSFFLAQILSIKLGAYCIWFSAEDNMIDRLCGIARYCNTSAGVIPLCSFHLPSPHTTIWLIVTPTQTWTFRGKIKISLHSSFFCHILTLLNLFEVWSKIIQRQAKSIFIAFGYDWNFGGDRNPIKFPGSGKAQIGPTAIRQM